MCVQKTDGDLRTSGVETHLLEGIISAHSIKPHLPPGHLSYSISSLTELRFHQTAASHAVRIGEHHRRAAHLTALTEPDTGQFVLLLYINSNFLFVVLRAVTIYNSSIQKSRSKGTWGGGDVRVVHVWLFVACFEKPLVLS